MKNLLISFLLLNLSLISNGWAADNQAALNMAKSTTEKMQAALNKNKAQLQSNPAGLYDLVSEIVLPHFDFNTISRWVLGKHWRTANKQQQSRFSDEFRTLLVRTYAKALLEYSDSEITFSPISGDSDDVTIKSEVNPGGGPKIPIYYRMHHKKQDWKVYDVSVDGISLVANYRGSIGSQVQREGIDAVIDKIAQRNKSGN